MATSLELLYDLVFVVAFSVAGSEFAHAVAAGHWLTGLGAFVFCLFAVIWAWINFVWFASAYDTDDWVYRLLTMVQMAGVSLLALGIPAIFHSFEEGGVLHNEVLVAGYVVMRLALLAQYLRAANRDRGRRRVLMTYVVNWGIAQIGWVVLLFAHIRLPWAIVLAVPIYALELVTPWLAERRGGMPWHAHHVAERYSLLAIISLGEGVVGTIGALTLLVDRGWTADAVILLVAGMGLTFGMWWTYFLMPMGEVLHVRRSRFNAFSFLHMPIYMAIAAAGAGLHVVSYLLDRSDVDFPVLVTPLGAVLSAAVPVILFVVIVFALYAYLVRTTSAHDAFHAALLGIVVAVAAAGVAVVAAGGPVMIGVLVVSFAPAVMCAAFELRGHRHLEEELEHLGIHQSADG